MNEQIEQTVRPEGEKAKIVMIYVGVAIISALILGCFIYIGKFRSEASEANAEKYRKNVVDVRIMSMEEMIGKKDILLLNEGFVAKNQDGEKVNLQSLKGKVWVFAQFYGSCPECNKFNFQLLKDLYKKHEGNPNFRIVTMSVMEHENGVEAMKSIADTLGVKTENWWFLTANVDAVNKYCTKNMMYLEFQENTDKDGSGMEGAIFHDMGIAVFNKDMIMKAKVDVFNPLKAKNTLLANEKTRELGLEVEDALNNF